MSDPSLTSSLQMLGELIVPVGPSPHEFLSAWLTELLTPLHLPEEYRQRVLKSVQSYVERALSADGGAPFGHLHLSIFGPKERTSSGQTWGFFRIEKIDSAGQNATHPDHTVEFYLYRERS